MHVSWKAFGWLSFAVIATYLAVLALGFYMPLQNDEVGWLFINHRSVIDGKNLIGLLPQCGKEAFSFPLPAVWYLPAYFNYLTYGQIDNPVWVRVGGILQFLIWLGLWLAIVMKLFNVPRNRWWAALAIILSFLGLDGIPLVLLVNRPEQILLIGAGLVTALALYGEDISKNPALRVISTLGLIFCVLYVHASHPKSIAMLPLEMVMAVTYLKHSGHSRAAALGVSALIMWIGLESYVQGLHRVNCPESADAMEFIRGVYFPIQTLWQAPATFFVTALHNLLQATISNYYLDIYFHLKAVIWLPLSLHPLSDITSQAISILDMDAWIIHLAFLAFSIWAFWRYGIACLRKTSDSSAQPASPVFLWLGLGSLLANMCAIFIFMTEGIFYSVELMIPLTLLAALLAFKLICPNPWENAKLVKFTMIVLAGAVLNQLLLLDRYGELIASPEAYAALPLNHLAFSPVQGYAATEKKITESAAQCNIPLDQSSRHVVVDDTTYHALHYTYEPLFFADSTWVCCHKIGPNTGKDGWPWFSTPDYLGMLRRYGSGGIVAKCALFPKSLRALAKEHEGLCCIQKSTIESGRE